MRRTEQSKRQRTNVLLAATAGALQLAAWGGGSAAQAASFTWAGPAGDSWSVAGNWSPNTGAPGAADTAQFDVAGTSTTAGQVTNVVDQNTTVSNLWYSGGLPAASTPIFTTTQIPTGVTLTVSNTGTGNSFIVGTETTTDSTVVTNVAITGAGTLAVNNPTGVFTVRQGGTANSGEKAFLDMSGLANFVANVNEFQIGVGSSSVGGRATATLTLGANNVITANTIRNSWGASSNSGASGLLLGAANQLNVGNLLTADRRGLAFMGFAPGVTNGAVTIRGTDGVSPAAQWNIGVMTSGDGSNGSGSVNFTAGTGRGSGSVDARVGSLILGRQAGGRGVGLLTYDQGVVNADYAVVGDSQASSAQTGAGTGNLSVLGAASLVVNNTLTLGRVINPGTATIAGTLTLGTSTTPGGKAVVAGDIIDGGGVSNIIANGGSLQAKHIGTTAAPIDNLTLNGTHLTLDLGSALAGGASIVNASTFTSNNTNGTTLISLKTAGGITAPTQFAAISYGALTAGGSFANFTLDSKLPSRMTAHLVDNTNAGTGAGSVGVSIDTYDAPKWTGGVNANWDINSTQNWQTIAGGAPTTYMEDLVTYSSTDNVLFDDSASGPTNVNLTTQLSPAGITVNNSAKDYTFSGAGAIIGAPDVVKSGTGRLSLLNTGSNVLGTVSVNGGTLAVVNNNTAFGAINVGSGGTLAIGDGATAGAGTIGAAAVNLSGGVVVLNRPDAVTSNSSINGNGELRKVGSATLTLNAASAFAGTANLLAGVTLPTNSSAFGGGTNTINVAAGAQIDLAANPTANQLNFGGRQFNIAGAGPDGTGAIVNSGTISQQNAFQRVTLTGDATIGGPGRIDVRNGNGTLDLAGHTLTKNDVGQFSAVGVTVTDGNLVVNGGTFSVETTSVMQAGAGSVNIAGDNVTANFHGVTTANNVTRPYFFNGNNGTINVSSGGTANFIGSNVTLNKDVTVNLSAGTLGHLTLTGNVTGPGGITKVGGNVLTLTGANSYGATTISAGTVQIGGGTTSGTLGAGDVANNANLVLNRSDALSVPNNISGTGAVHVAGTGTTTLSGVNSYSGPTNVNAGNLVIGSGDAIGSGASLLNIAGGAAAHIGTSLPKAVKVNGLTNAGTFDVNNGQLVVDYSGATPFDTIRTQVISGYAGGSWNGVGINTSAPSTVNGHSAAVGYAEASNAGAANTTWNGQAVDGDAVLVRYTLSGDSNVDGKVDLTDFTFLAANFNKNGGATWLQGDYNYDGNVDLTDFTFLASNFNQSVSSGDGGGAAAATTSSLGGLVPEPASLSVVALLAGGLLGRRKRRR